MERINNTKAGVCWTPAPAPSSPTSSVIYEEDWDGEDEEQTEKNDNFDSQMDENGIIGLSEALEVAELVDSDCNSNSRGPLTPEEEDPSGHERETPEELSNNLSEHLSHTESTEEDETLSSYEDLIESFKAQKLAEKVGQEEPGKDCVSEWDKYMEEKDGEVAGKRTPSFPHLLHFTPEEMAAAQGIDTETFPDNSAAESLPESHRSHLSLKSSPRCPEAQDKSDKQPSPSPRKLRQPSPEATYPQTRSLGTAKSLQFKQKTASPDRESRIPRPRSNAAEVDESRKGPLSYRIPDFSNVEPRVFFPKDGYTPPKSRRCFERESLSPGLPFVFKSPADIVKEVLLNSHDTSPASSDSYKPISSALNSSVPQDFRSRLQASDLLDQLQVLSYYRLLTKHAEAENTIDRLRLEAKDFIDPGEQEQACSASHRQTTFEDLLKSKRLKRLDQKKGVSQLAEGLDSLERGYLLARDDCKLLQQRGAENSFFDRDRELEGLVFQCGLHMEELKELVERMQQEQPISEAPPSPPPHPTPSSGPSEGEETHTQSPAGPVLVDPGEAAAVEVSAGSEDSDEEEETLYLNSLYLKPQNGKHRHVQQDLAPLRNHYQSLGELSRRIDHSQREGAPLSAALRRDVQPGREEEERQCQENLETSAAQKSKSDHQDSPPVCTKKAQSSRSSPPPRSASITTPPAHRPCSPSITTPPTHRPRSASITTPPAHPPCSPSITTPPLIVPAAPPSPHPPLILPQPLHHHTPHSSSPQRLHHHTPRSLSPQPLHHQPPAHRPRSPSITTPPAHRPRSPSITTPPAHRPRSPSITTPPAHRPRSPSITTPPAHPTRSPSITTPPAQPPRSRRTLEVGESPSSSLSSLGEITLLERRNSKLLTGIRRVLSQDGIISPETDSGFVCSESSRLTPAAEASPVHQRASERRGFLRWSRYQHHLRFPTVAKSTGDGAQQDQVEEKQNRAEETHPLLSPQRCVPLTGQTRADSGTTLTVSEHRFTQSINSSPSFSLASALGHHDDPLRALSSSQAANRNDAIQTLQVEVRRMRESLDSCLRNKNPVQSPPHLNLWCPGVLKHPLQLQTATAHTRILSAAEHSPGSSLVCLHKCVKQQTFLTAEGGLLFVLSVCHMVPEGDLKCQLGVTESSLTPLAVVSVLSVDAMHPTAARSQQQPRQVLRVRGRREVKRRRRRRSLSVDKQRCVDSSLERAIRAARSMRHLRTHGSRSEVRPALPEAPRQDCSL
ncbi:hypothetical protein F7725_015304 [Dissostichus mawsoni]|uniref:AT-hook-containing transcription factor n=1 Tax=Dissostichus mawsoni TaxID=36200 RepID=A0A7J5YJY7_DISMA|nr:hypothetical protein F7725_015304 [Dissostichus mawsoni]